MKIRTILIDGFYIDIYDFGYAKFFYPLFNGNAEFPLNNKGFNNLRSYIRTVRYFNDLIFNKSDL